MSNGCCDGFVPGTAGGGGGADGDVAISAGSQVISNGTAVFSNANGVTFGMSNSSVITASVAAATETPFGVSAGSQSVSTGTVAFANSNGLTFGMSGSSRITASYSQSTAPSAIQAGSQTATSGTVVFSNSNGVTFGMSNSSVVTASYSQSTAPSAFVAGTQTATSGTIVFSDSNGVAFGMSGSTQITASVSALKTLSAGTTNLQGPGWSLADSNGVSFGVSGSTVTASVAAQTDVTVSMLFPAEFGGILSSNNIGQSSLQFQPVNVMLPVTFAQLHLPVRFSNQSTGGGSTGTVSMSISFGIYTVSGSTLSRLSSTSIGQTVAYASNNSASTNSGMRLLSIGFSGSLSKGPYWMAVVSESVTSSQNATLNNILAAANFGDMGIFGSGLAAVSGLNMARGMGIYSAQTASLPASVQFSEILGTDQVAYRPQVFILNVST